MMVVIVMRLVLEHGSHKVGDKTNNGRTFYGERKTTDGRGVADVTQTT